METPKAPIYSKLPPKIAVLVGSNIHLIKYGIIGVFGLGIDFSIYYVLVEFANVHYQIANVTAVIITLTNNFLWNYYLNFKVTDKFLLRMFKYYLIGASGLAISALGLYVLVDIFYFSKILSKPVMLFFVTLSQYYLNKQITFKN